MTVDRPAAIRAALRRLVAERGFHGASMSAVASEAGVATGTAYVHYPSKEELVYASYLELKSDLSSAALDGLNPSAPWPDRWCHILTAAYHFLSAEPERARFLTQMEESPFHAEARRRVMALGDPLWSAFDDEDLAAALLPVPPEVIYALSLGAIVRLVAAEVDLSPRELDLVVDATWRAVTQPR